MNPLDALSPGERDGVARAVAAMQAGRPLEAEKAYRQVLATAPQCWPVRNEWGNLLLNLLRPAEAEAELAAVVRAAPDFAPGWVNWGNALVALERRREAGTAYQKALELAPALAAARYNLGLVQIATGQWEEGWRNYEARWECELAGARRDWPMPQWRGDGDLSGKTFLVHAEQGLGDTLQFCRYLKPLLEAGAKVVLEAQAPLVELLQASFSSVTVVAKGTTLPAADWHSPLLSLPAALSGRGVTWLAEAPYLSVPDARRSEWVARLPAGRLPRVGLVWSANVRHWRGFVRNVGPRWFARALEGVPVEPVALMKEIRPEDAAAARHFHNLGTILRDFADTAALIENLDLVLTVDTSVAHLAGGLGKPVWFWLPFGADWRWLERRGDSPFYPTARLFRQPAPGDWEAVAKAISGALRERYT